MFQARYLLASHLLERFSHHSIIQQNKVHVIFDTHHRCSSAGLGLGSFIWSCCWLTQQVGSSRQRCEAPLAESCCSCCLGKVLGRCQIQHVGEEITQSTCTQEQEAAWKIATAKETECDLAQKDECCCSATHLSQAHTALRALQDKHSASAHHKMLKRISKCLAAATEEMQMLILRRFWEWISYSYWY